MVANDEYEKERIVDYRKKYHETWKNKTGKD